MSPTESPIRSASCQPQNLIKYSEEGWTHHVSTPWIYRDDTCASGHRIDINVIRLYYESCFHHMSQDPVDRYQDCYLAILRRFLQLRV